MSIQVPPLVLRIPKGAPLSAQEGDTDFSILRDAINAAFALLGIALNSNGTIKNNAVTTNSILDRAVTQQKLDWLANFFTVASGTNAYSATISPTAGYATGDGLTTALWLPVKFTNANSAASTIVINGSAPVPLKKFANVDLAAGDIVAGSIHLLVFDGTNFQIPTITTKGNRVNVFAMNSVDAVTMDISFTKPAAGVWQDFELDYVCEAESGGAPNNFKCDFTYQTAPEAGNTPSVSSALGCGNTGKSFFLGNSGEFNLGKWWHRGLVAASLIGTNTFTVRATRTASSGAMVVQDGYFTGKAAYV